jgi:hypothetical protein
VAYRRDGDLSRHFSTIAFRSSLTAGDACCGGGGSSINTRRSVSIVVAPRIGGWPTSIS